MTIHQMLTLAIVAVIFVFFLFVAKGRGGSWGFSSVMGLVGAGEFVLLVKLGELVVSSEQFFFSPIATAPDENAFWLYVMNPTVAIVLLSGLAVAKWLPVPTSD